MRGLRDSSLKRKLTVVSFVTSASALLLVGLIFTAFAVYADRTTLGRQLATQADITGFTVTPALLFEDDRAAVEALAALRAEPQIRAAAIFRADGSLFARYLRAGASAPAIAPPPAGDSENLDYDEGTYVLTRAIRSHERVVGTVLLQADLAALEARLKRYGAFTIAVLSVSLVLSLGVSSLLQREISQPLLELVKTARTVTSEKDYGIRAAVRGRDELGVLVDAFNEMLSEIEARDVQLQKVNHKLQLRTDELGRKNEEVEAFVYIVSHDLRGPLVNLEGFSRELRISCESLAKLVATLPMSPEVEAQARELTEDEIPTSLRFISASTAKFDRLINALLQLSRSGRRDLNPELLDMNALVTMTIDSLMSLVEKSGAQIEVGQLPPAYGDTTAIGQVISNLLTNALRYLQPGRPGRIRITGEHENGMSRYSVEDNGVGMPATAQQKLFQVFHRMRPDLADGEGIGLATVKRVIERHGGRVSAQSTEGIGTTFSFSLPAGPATEGDLK